MRNVEVVIVSEQTIKPSSSTPDRLRSFRLCLLDQYSPVFYVPLVLIYMQKDSKHILPQLKKSLSDTLSTFYPLAGRIKDHSSIDCNDEGISYLEARANCSVADFLKEPTEDLQRILLPRMQNLDSPITEMIRVQVTTFNCGGVAIGCYFCHKIIDATSMSCFLNCWATITKKCSSPDQFGTVPDLMTASMVLPPSDDDHLFPLDMSCVLSVIDSSEPILRRYVFNSSSISSLKDIARSESVPNPTRVEVVSSFMWKHAMAAASKVNSLLGRDDDDERLSMLAQAINIRSRVVPPLSRHCMGSMVVHTTAQVNSTEEKKELRSLVARVHASISRMNENMIAKLQSGEVFENGSPFFKECLKDRSNMYFCTSWCRLGINEVDFGRGKPAWIGLLGHEQSAELRNVLTLIDTYDGEGIEAWFGAGKQEIEILDTDQDFLAFATRTISAPELTG